MTDPTGPTDPAPRNAPPVPAWPVVPPPGRTRRPAGRTVHRILGVWLAVVILAGGAYASARLLLADERGAGSPEAAGEELLAALDDGDLLGVIDLLPEGERELLVDLTDELLDQGERLGLLGDDLELDGIPGIDVRFTDAELHVQELGDGLAMVSVVDGTASVEVDGDRFTGSLGEVVEAVTEANDVEVALEDFEGEVDLGEAAEGDEELAEEYDGELVYSWGVAVVEEDGRWFPSLAFTIAEGVRAGQARFGSGPPPPDLDDGVEPDGGRDPLDAVQDLLDGAVEGDLEAMLSIVDPGELGALQVYAESFAGDLDTGGDTGITIEITDADVRSFGGGVHRVVPTGVEAEVDLGDGQIRMTIEDGCVTLVGESDDADDDELDDLDVEVCEGEVGELPTELGEDFDDLEVPDEVTELIEAFEPIEVGIITVERDGEHFVSPIRTIFDVVAAAFRGLEPADLEEGGIVYEALTGGLDDAFGTFVEQFEASIEERLDDLEDDFPGPDDDSDDDDESSDVPIRPATGASGPDGALLVGDVVAGDLAPGDVVTFSVVAVAGEGYIGAQTLDGADLTITVRDAATGEELDFSDDFVGTDPEAFVVTQEGQRLTVEVAGYTEDDAGAFVAYYET